MQELKNKIIDYWHISRTALAGMPTVPTRSDRIKYVMDTLKKYDADLIDKFVEGSPIPNKKFYFFVLDTTAPTTSID
jgi:hypothetical protein